MSAEGLQRSAILMMSLGESEAAEVLKHLGPREVQKLGATMAALKNVSRERVLDAFDAFFVEAEDLPLDVDSNEYIRTVFRKALGSEPINRQRIIALGHDPNPSRHFPVDCEGARVARVTTKVTTRFVSC